MTKTPPPIPMQYENANDKHSSHPECSQKNYFQIFIFPILRRYRQLLFRYTMNAISNSIQ